jgi:hypothetical protein
VLPNALEKHCIEAEPFLDKNAGPAKNAAFAHLALWICRRFSTGAAVSRVFLTSEQTQTGVRLRFLAMSSRHGIDQASALRSASGFSPFTFLPTKQPGSDRFAGGAR